MTKKKVANVNIKIVLYNWLCTYSIHFGPNGWHEFKTIVHCFAFLNVFELIITFQDFNIIQQA